MDEADLLTAPVYDDRFNSATALGPWMTGRLIDRGLAHLRLQFGHGIGAVDDAALAR